MAIDIRCLFIFNIISLLAQPHQKLYEVLEKVCLARGWKLDDYTPTRIDGSEIDLNTLLKDIKDAGVFYAPRGIYNNILLY
jgi:hypothetical protein